MENYETETKTQKDFDKTISPTLVCTVLSILMIIGLILGFATKSALIVALFLLPVVAYEIYRTRGPYTSFSSWMIIVVLLAEIVLIVFNINYDLGKFLDLDYTYVGGQYVPLGDIKILGPTLLAIFSLILLLRTYGPYTKWLSVIIFVSAFIMVYILSPIMFKELIRSAVQHIFWYF